MLNRQLHIVSFHKFALRVISKCLGFALSRNTVYSNDEARMYAGSPSSEIKAYNEIPTGFASKDI